MAKSKTLYQCQQCGGQSSKWQGQCPHCFEWNCLEEQVLQTSTSRFKSLNKKSNLININEVEINEIFRHPTNNGELDRVLGGGLVPGGVTLIGGDPGIGKSTLLIQALSSLTKNPNQEITVIYITGEESIEQVAMRARRLDLEVSDLLVLSEINLNNIITVIEKEKPSVVVIDSIQTLFSEELNSAPGSVSQVRECAAQLTRVAKANDVSMIFVGHVTKEGSIAGPRVLEHIVDTVLYFEGESNSSFRLVRSIKNRYGAVNELGIYAMTEKGLKEILNPSAIFLSETSFDQAGSVVTVMQEGTRPILIELQALVDESKQSSPKRLSVGLESNRISMILAVLNKHLGLSCHTHDVFLNAVGGVKIAEPGVDLAVLIAIASSLQEKQLHSKTLIFGEVGLGGEVRPVVRGQERIQEAIKLGFKRIILPRKNLPKKTIHDVELIPVDNIKNALNEAFK
ncbi:MAG: DNA repair protein RadA [Methylophilaceae bacterium]